MSYTGTAPSPFASGGNEISPRAAEEAISRGKVRRSPFADARPAIDLLAESWDPERAKRGGAWVAVASVVRSPFAGEPTEHTKPARRK
jgi:hypothetical protein